MILRGGAYKADLRVVDVGEGPMVVKDFRDKSWLARTLGRLQISRELAAYRWLGGMEGIPAVIGQVDPFAFAMEKIDGQQLAFAGDLPEDRGAIVERLQEVVRGLHERGLVHLDLRGRENVLIRPDRTLVVLDLAGAVRFRPGGLWYRLFFPLFSLPDRAALIKWKEMIHPGHLTGQELAFQRRFRVWRSLWVFNRKPEPK